MNSTFLHGNWIDLIILFVIIFFVSDAIRVGFWVVIAEFLSFLSSIILALWGYRFAANLLRSNFSLSHSLSNALGFLVTAVLSEAVLSFILTLIISKIPYKFWKTRWNKFFAIIPAIGEALILSAFILTFVLALPISPLVKKDITDASVGGILVRSTSGVESKLNDIFGGVLNDALTYFTVEPGSNEIVPLGNSSTSSLTVDAESEQVMFAKVNEERTSRGIAALSWSPELNKVARDYATLMWKEQFFGHVSPEGQTLEIRLKDAKINYSFAGENLALAPTVSTAHTGLMNSTGHRENILNTAFHKVGIGVIDNGYNGKMFVQEFTD